MRGHFLRASLAGAVGGGGGYTPTDSDAAAYITAVENEDGQALEDGVREAIDDFVIGCKTDGIWSAIKASCILAGARTLDGALVPLVGAAPTNDGFVSGDYNRETGLVGDGSTKYLNSNRSTTDDPNNSAHMSVYLGGGTTVTGTQMLIGCRGSNSEYVHDIYIRDGNQYVMRNKAESNFVLGGQTISRSSPGSTAEFLGSNRTARNACDIRAGANTNTNTRGNNGFTAAIRVFGRNDLNSGSSLFTTARLSFYSIGESLNLALLGARVSTLMADIAAAIP